MDEIKLFWSNYARDLLSSNIFQDKQVGDAQSLNKEKKQIQILIAESESELSYYLRIIYLH